MSFVPHYESIFPMLFGLSMVERYTGSMVFIGVFATMLVLLLAAAATALCVFAYVKFRHRASLWLLLATLGFVCFLFTQVGHQITTLGGDSSPPRGLMIFWLLPGSILLTISVPCFLLTVFGVSIGRGLRIVVAVETLAVGLFSLACLITGWHDSSASPAFVTGLRRGFLFGFLAVALALALIFKSRVPDRGLHRALITQCAALVFLFPLIVLEDANLLEVPGFPNAGGLCLMAIASALILVHVPSSLMRAKYVHKNVVSPSFVKRFDISDRELDVIQGIFDGLSNEQIAEKLFISIRTVGNHLYRIYQKVGIKNRFQLYNILRSDVP